MGLPFTNFGQAIVNASRGLPILSRKGRGKSAALTVSQCEAGEHGTPTGESHLKKVVAE